MTAAYTAAELIKGRVEVGHRIHLKYTAGASKGSDVHGDVCETVHAGKERPCAVVKHKHGLACVRFENVAPNARQKRNVT